MLNFSEFPWQVMIWQNVQFKDGWKKSLPHFAPTAKPPINFFNFRTWSHDPMLTFYWHQAGSKHQLGKPEVVSTTDTSFQSASVRKLQREKDKITSIFLPFLFWILLCPKRLAFSWINILLFSLKNFSLRFSLKNLSFGRNLLTLFAQVSK